MTIKSDRWIRTMAQKHGMIEPFESKQVRDGGCISYGVSSFGYDFRVADEWKVFTNVFSSVVDPKDFKQEAFVEMKADHCVIPPNSFALARTVEYWRIPRDALVICLGKSTYARCGIILNVTPFEPEWEGICDHRDIQHDAAARQNLRQRGHRAGDFPAVGRTLRDILPRPSAANTRTGRNRSAARREQRLTL